MFHQLSIPSNQLFVWAFIPYRAIEQGLISEFYDHLSYRQELEQVFAELEIRWKWQPITLETMHTVVEEVIASKRDCVPVVLNYCDGFDAVDGYPGLSVIKLLEANDIIFTGADSDFEYRTISKIRMKQFLIKAGVSTAPYEVVPESDPISGICDRLGTPLILKPSTSTAGYGLSSNSIVYNDQEAELQVDRLSNEQETWKFSRSSILIERFINGREFTVFIVGSAQQPADLKIYPPLELVFHSSLADFERIKSYNLHSYSSLEGYLHGSLVTSSLLNQLAELSKYAYCAVGGNGYGRVDIRMDQTSQELFVLEVNANCSISSQPISPLLKSGQTSVGTILHLAGIPFEQLMSEIIGNAFARNSTRNLLESEAV